MLAQQFNFLAVSVVTKSPHPFRSEPRSDGLERHATLLAQRVSTHLFTHSPSVLFPRRFVFILRRAGRRRPLRHHHRPSLTLQRGGCVFLACIRSHCTPSSNCSAVLFSVVPSSFFPVFLLVSFRPRGHTFPSCQAWVGATTHGTKASLFCPLTNCCIHPPYSHVAAHARISLRYPKHGDLIFGCRHHPRCCRGLSLRPLLFHPPLSRQWSRIVIVTVVVTIITAAVS